MPAPALQSVGADDSLLSALCTLPLEPWTCGYMAEDAHGGEFASLKRMLRCAACGGQSSE